MLTECQNEKKKVKPNLEIIETVNYNVIDITMYFTMLLYVAITFSICLRVI